MKTKKIDSHVVYYYELGKTELERYQNGALPDTTDLVLIEKPSIAYYRFLFDYIGSKWNWSSRKLSPDDELEKILWSENSFLYVLYSKKNPIGMFEFSRLDKTTAEIEFFGIHESVFGKGLGKALLHAGLQKVLEIGTEKVVLHTCEFDAKNARRVYEKAGFKLVAKKTESMEMVVD